MFSERGEQLEIGSTVFQLNERVEKRIEGGIQPEQPEGEVKEGRGDLDAGRGDRRANDVRKQEDQKDENENEERSSSTTIPMDPQVALSSPVVETEFHRLGRHRLALHALVRHRLAAFRPEEGFALVPPAST